jgi:hypothetical protein
MSRDVQAFASVDGRLAGMKVLAAHNYSGRLRAKLVLNSRPKHRAPECQFAAWLGSRLRLCYRAADITVRSQPWARRNCALFALSLFAYRRFTRS